MIESYSNCIPHRPHLSSSCLLLGQRSDSQVWLDDLHLRPDFLGLVCLDGGMDNHVVTGNPVNGGSDLVLVAGLEGVHDSEHLGSVATGRSRVGENGSDNLLGVNDEDGADGESYALLIDIRGVLVVDHVVLQGNLSVLVSNDREVQVAATDLVDVLDPVSMAVNGVGGKTDQLDTSLGELGFQFCESSKLSGAH